MSKSSVLVKGMEMPQKCGQCKLYHVEYPMYCMAVEGHHTVGAPYGMPRPDWCPLTEVKEPHGDLVDKDKLMQEFMDSDLDHLQRDDWKEVIQIVTDAPTIDIEPLTDKEQRIFLAAMERERKICKEVDDLYVHEPHEVLLIKVCDEIKRKVKRVLWN